jgi:hypothetical protein
MPARLLAPPRVVGTVTRKLAKTFTGYCLLAAPTVMVVADKEKIALMHVVGALAGLLWWWAELRVRAACEQGHQAGVRDTLTVLTEASEAVAQAARSNRRTAN